VLLSTENVLNTANITKCRIGHLCRKGPRLWESKSNLKGCMIKVKEK